MTTQLPPASARYAAIEDPAGPPPIIATSKSGFVITNASSWKLCLKLFRLPLLAGLLERVHRHISQQLVPGMLRVLLDLRYHFLHFFENRRRRIVVNVALQQFQNVKAVAWIAHEVREQHVQPVIDGDEFVPVLGTESELGFVVRKAFAREIISLQGSQHVRVSKAGAIQRDAYAGRKDRIDEATCISH